MIGMHLSEPLAVEISPTKFIIFNGVSVKNVHYILVLLFLSTNAKTQNAIGFSLGYANVKATEWNHLLDKYNSSDTVLSKQPHIKHMPLATLVYERKMTEYLYIQGYLSIGYSSSKSKQNGDLKWEILAPGAGLNINWYPFKMIKGTSKTPLNPILLQFTGAGNYLKQNLTLNGQEAISAQLANYKTSNFAFLFGGGIGYDLHFGKHIVVQTVFDFHYSPAMDMPDLLYFIPNAENLGYHTQTSATSIGGRINLLYLFKGRGKRNNINSKKSMFS